MAAGSETHRDDATPVKEGRVGRIQPYDMSGIVRGADGVLHYEGLPETVLELLRNAVDAVPDREALVEVGGRRLTYGELWDRAARIAGGLVSEGVKRGDRVAIRFGNGVDWCLAFTGTLMAGAVVVPINTRFAEPEVEYVLGDAGAKVALGPHRPLPDAVPYVCEDLHEADTGALWYTSGTTGFPKGAVMTHENFVATAESTKRHRAFGGRAQDGGIRGLISVPLFHVTGCNAQLIALWLIEGTAVIMAEFDVQMFLRTIVDERIDSMTTVPAIYWYAMHQENFRDFDLSHLGWASYGGSPMAPQQVEEMRNAFPNARLGNGFGLTESAAAATYLPHEWALERAETVGFAAPPVELDLADVEESGAGELLIRGPNVVNGYWNNPHATAAAFVDGWLHSGDVATIDDDGFVTVVDRVKDMINRGGENVYSVEVENALAAHPKIYEVAVVGVPDTMMGEKVGAIVVPRPGQTLTPEDVVDFAKGRLADFKIPQFISMRTDPLPRNPGGKVLKRDLRDATEWGKQLRR
jgi:acyl-CoA synthetase (AMP-forming)/AMP-acid ligase II